MDFSSFRTRLASVDPKSYERPNRFFFEDRAWILRALFLVALGFIVVVPVLIVMRPRLIIYHHQR